MSDTQLDLLVVGCGAGGLATAVQFLQSAPGGRVVVLERTSKRERGGNTAWTGAFFRLETDGSPAADFTTRMRDLSDDKTDPAIIARLADSAQDTMRWLNHIGVATKSDLTYFLTSKGPRLMPAGGGGAIVETLAQRVEELGGVIEYQMTAIELVQDASGAVVGVDALEHAGQVRRFHARTVVLASGG